MSGCGFEADGFVELVEGLQRGLQQQGVCFLGPRDDGVRLDADKEAGDRVEVVPLEEGVGDFEHFRKHLDAVVDIGETGDELAIDAQMSSLVVVRIPSPHSGGGGTC